MTSLSEAVILCTRNRPSDLRSTLQSIAAQQGASRRHLLVIDASDPAIQDENQTVLDQLDPGPWSHHRYDGPPSPARQRNRGISLLPSAVDVVHFLDDDVTLCPRYFHTLTRALQETPNLGGVGGVVHEETCSHPPEVSSSLKRFFLLDGPPGKMLPSGHGPTAQRYPLSIQPPDTPLSTEYLNGCSTYRREVIDTTRFDPLLDAPLLDDLDLSYRVSRTHGLSVIPQAALVHHCASSNQISVIQYKRRMLTHRYWFVCKHGLSKTAFWWSVLGQLGARLLSPQPTKWESLSGLLQGIADILRGNSPLLSSLK